MRRFQRINDILGRGQNLMILFPVGFVLGLVFGILFGKTEQIKEIVAFSIKLLQEVTIYYPLLVLYVLWERCKNLIFLILCSCMPIGPQIYAAIILVLGSILGFECFAFAACEGFSGLTLFLLSFVPQGICYGAVLFYGSDFFLSIWSRIQKSDSRGQESKGEYVSVAGYRIRKTVLLIVVAIMGLVTECYVNPFLLKMCVKFLK